jgi:hypothetical protein
MQSHLEWENEIDSQGYVGECEFDSVALEQQEVEVLNEHEKGVTKLVEVMIAQDRWVVMTNGY